MKALTIMKAMYGDFKIRTPISICQLSCIKLFIGFSIMLSSCRSLPLIDFRKVDENTYHQQHCSKYPLSSDETFLYLLSDGIYEKNVYEGNDTIKETGSWQIEHGILYLRYQGKARLPTRYRIIKDRLRLVPNQKRKFLRIPLKPAFIPCSRYEKIIERNRKRYEKMIDKATE